MCPELGKHVLTDMISVIIPAYNCESTIIRTLKSLEHQSFKNFEIIIVNDGSTDKTLEVVNEYKNRDTELNITVLSQENGGPGTARNYGLENANGEFISFVDADDIVESNYLCVLYHGIMEPECDFAFSSYYRIDNDNPSNKTLVKNELYGLCDSEDVFCSFICNRTYISLWNSIFKKSTIDSNNLRFIDYCRSGEDVEFISRYLLNSKKVNVMDKPIYSFFYDTSRAMTRLVNSSAYLSKIEDSIYWPLLDLFSNAGWKKGYEALLHGKFAFYSATQLLIRAKTSDNYRVFRDLIKNECSSFIEIAQNANKDFLYKRTYLKTKIVSFLAKHMPFPLFAISRRL